MIQTHLNLINSYKLILMYKYYIIEYDKKFKRKRKRKFVTKTIVCINNINFNGFLKYYKQP